MPRIAGWVVVLLLLPCVVFALDPIQITTSSGTDRHPSWSPNGQFIVFESNRSGHWRIYRINPDGTNEIQLTFGPEEQVHPELSPDGTRIVYVYGNIDPSSGGVNSSGLQIIPVGGGSPVTLIPNPGFKIWHPTWSSDQQYIYFDRADLDWDIYRVPVAGGAQSLVMSLGIDSFASISPDNSRITYLLGLNQSAYNIAEAPLNNPTNYTFLTHETQNTVPDDYSPDGLRMVYTSRKILGKLELFELDLISGLSTRLTFDAEGMSGDPTNHLADYSPDGTAIVFSSMRVAGNENLWILPLSTPPPPPENALSLGSGAGISGAGTVTIPVSFTSNVASPALEFQIADMPDWVEAVGVTPRGRAGALTAAFSDQGSLHVVMYGASGVKLLPGTGPILDVAFMIKPEAVLHDSTLLSFSNIIMSDSDGHAVTVTSEGSVIRIERMAGDVNGDNQVDAGDLVRLVEIILGTGAPPSSDELAEADCNHDSAYNALDIVCLLDDVQSKPSVSFVALPAGVWSVKADEPVLGFQVQARDNAWTSSVSDLAPFQLHQDAAGLIAFDAQGTAWPSGDSNTFRLAGSIGLKAFGAGGRALPVRVEGSEIHIGTPLPAGLRVLPASPNPFARSTEISFSIDRATTVRISVYDVRGAKVSGMAARPVTPGRQTWRWSALNDRGQALPSGLYLAVVEAGTSRSVVRLAHLR
jgi:hypothetical protein